MAVSWRKNEPVASKRRAAVTMYQNDGTTLAPLATAFATGGGGDVKVRQGGTTWADAAGTFTNTGVDGHWVYEATQAETNFDGTEFEVRIDKSGFRRGTILVDMNTAATVWDSLVSEHGDANSFGEAINEVQADTNDIQSRLPASLTGGRIRAHIEALDSGVITLAAIGATGLAALGIVRSNTAQTAGPTTLRLDAGASGTDDFYNNGLVFIYDGLGAGQFAVITDYQGATKDCAISPSWVAVPDNTSKFIVFAAAQSSGGASAPTAATIADAIWDELRSGHTTPGSFGEGVVISSMLTDALGAAGVSAAAVTKIQSGLATASAQTTLQTAATDLSTKLGTPAGASVSADIASLDSKLGTPAGASVSVDVAAVKTDTASALTQIAAVAADVNNLEKVALGKWKIQGTQLILYEADGTTPFRTFNLLDDAGAPSNTRIFERVPA